MEIKQKASLFAAGTALVLASSKFAIGLGSGSMAVVSSALDSLLDVFMSTMNFFAIRKAAQPADRSHQYGHSKIEDFAGLIQSLVIVFSGSVIIHRAVQAFLRKETISYSSLDFVIMGISLVFTMAICTVLIKIGNRTGSNALKADALHYTSDLYSNTGAIAAILLTYFTGIILFDLVFAVIVGCIIIFSAIKIFRSSLSGIMDASVPSNIEGEIEAIIDNMPYPAAGYHKLRTRRSGSKKYIDFHFLICRKLHIDEAHALAERVENEIAGKIALIDAVAHIEPCARECNLTEETCSMLKLPPAGKTVQVPG
jgi:cation diffusion facilitator family transporter